MQAARHRSVRLPGRRAATRVRARAADVETAFCRQLAMLAPASACPVAQERRSVTGYAGISGV